MSTYTFTLWKVFQFTKYKISLLVRAPPGLSLPTNTKAYTYVSFRKTIVILNKYLEAGGSFTQRGCYELVGIGA